MTHKIQSRYMSDTYGIHKDTQQEKQDTYLEPYLRPRLDTPKTPRYVSCMYPVCIPHVSQMYSACIPHVSWLPLRIHVSRMYPLCIPHVSFISEHLSLGMHLRYMYLIMYLGCIPHVSWSPLQIHVSRMYPACILHIRYVPRHDASKIHVSVILYLGVSCDVS